MKISKNNYESFFIDYLDGNLSDSQIREIEAFLMNHDDLREEFEGLEKILLKPDNIKYDLLEFLIKQKRQGKKIAAYGAAAKGNTLLNYCGIKKDLIDYVVDISPYKQGKYLPGSHIPVVGEEEIRKRKPNYVLILPWNIKEEIMEQLSYVFEWGGKFIVPIPELKIIP